MYLAFLADSANPTVEVTSRPHASAQDFAKQLYNLADDSDVYHTSPPYDERYGSVSSFSRRDDRGRHSPAGDTLSTARAHSPYAASSRSHSPHTTGSRSHSPHAASSRSHSPYATVGSVDKLRHLPQIAVNSSLYSPSSASLSHDPVSYSGRSYSPSITELALGVSFAGDRLSPSSSLGQTVDPNEINVDTDPLPVETWMSREGSARGSVDKRTRLFGSCSPEGATAQKSAFKAVGKNGTLKKNVRFADKNETLDISQDDASSVDALSDDANSVSSATYVLEDGSTIESDTIV